MHFDLRYLNYQEQAKECHRDPLQYRRSNYHSDISAQENALPEYEKEVVPCCRAWQASECTSNGKIEEAQLIGKVILST